jgi:hypothetical protein
MDLLGYGQGGPHKAPIDWNEPAVASLVAGEALQNVAKSHWIGVGDANWVSG